MARRPAAPPPVDRADRRGLLYGLGAYLVWGLVPLFWPLVRQAGAVEILAHRVVWSLVIATALALILLPRRWLRPLLNRRTLTLLALAAAFVAVNWGVYIWAVNSGHVVEAALGYYINPIFTVLLGVIFLRERLARTQWVAVGFAAAAVLVLTVDYGQPPWVALILASSFATYGLLKNRINSGAVATLTVESAMLTPAALVYLGLPAGHGQPHLRPPRLGPQPAAGRRRPGDGGPVAAVQRCGRPDPAQHPRPAAVPDSDGAVPARGVLLRRSHVAGALGRVRAHLGRVVDLEWSRPDPGLVAASGR